MHIPLKEERATLPDTSELKRDPEWLELIARLRDGKVSLISDFKSRFPVTTLYAGKVSEAEVDALIESTIDMYLVLLSGEPIDPILQRLPFNLGRDRARQGVPSQQLLEGVRTNSRVIWNALRELSTDASAMTLVRNTDAVLSLVEWHVREVQSSYLREEEILNRFGERRRQRAVSRIFDTQPLNRDDLLIIATDLGVAEDSSFDVVVQLGPHADDCVLCAHTGTMAFAHELAEGTCHFRSEGNTDLLTELANSHASIVTDVVGLAAVPDAAQAAITVSQARVAHKAMPVMVSDAWPHAAWKALTAGVPESLLPMDLGAIRAMGAEGRRRLLETIAMYLETGSIKETSAALYCHRNTVVKRLTQFESLTGLNLGIPKQAALATLALTAISTE